LSIRYSIDVTRFQRAIDEWLSRIAKALQEQQHGPLA
jgi:hypothetical protein